MVEESGRKEIARVMSPEMRMLGRGEPKPVLLLREGEKAPSVHPARGGETRMITSGSNAGQDMAPLSKRAAGVLDLSLERSKGPDGKIKPEDLPRLCRIGTNYLRHRERECSEQVDAKDSIHQNISLAVLGEEAFAYVERVVGNHGERKVGDLGERSNSIILDFINELMRVERLEREKLASQGSFSEEGGGPDGRKSLPPILLTRTEGGRFREIGNLEAAEKFFRALDNDVPHEIFVAFLGPDGQRVPAREPEDQLTHRLLEENGQEHRRNVKFYYSKKARNGMDRSTWPTLLTEALEAERWWAGLMMSSRKEKDGTFLECGGGDGRCLVQNHKIRGLGNSFTLYDYFGHIVSIDYSVQMGRAASRRIARMVGSRGVEKSRIITGELGNMGYLGSHFVDLALCTFNTYGNLNIRDQMGMAKELNRVLRRFDPDAKPPAMAFFSVYRERPETREMQKEFYTNMGMRIIKVGENVTITSTGENGGSSTLKSQRFTEEKLRYPLESNGLIVLEIFPISTIMWGAIAVSSDISNGHVEPGDPYEGVLGRVGLQKLIDEAWERDKTGNWKWGEPLN